MAHEREGHERIALLLDDAEILAIKMAQSVDNEGEVAELLAVLIEHFPHMADTAKIFDGTVDSPPWQSWRS